MTGQQLRILRQQAGLTRTALAERAGCDRSLIGRYELLAHLPARSHAMQRVLRAMAPSCPCCDQPDPKLLPTAANLEEASHGGC